jgi:hypothetical protein
MDSSISGNGNWQYIQAGERTGYPAGNSIHQVLGKWNICFAVFFLYSGK